MTPSHPSEKVRIVKDRPQAEAAFPRGWMGWLFALSLAFFLVNIHQPGVLNFDEFGYIPAAKQMLELGVNTNPEHPPLAKMIMALGVAVFGDQPLGWRFMAAVFGSLTLCGMFALAFAIFRERKIALWCALLSLANGLLYVQARIGMLDTFMTGFMVWGLAAFLFFLKPSRAIPAKRRPVVQSRLLLASGVCFALATACKWYAVVPWGGCLALALWDVIKGRIQDRTQGLSQGSGGEALVEPLWGFQDGRGAWIGDWNGVLRGLWSWFWRFGLVPLGIYFATFSIYFFMPRGNPVLGVPWDILRFHKTMWEAQRSVVSPHPYMSSWKAWPLLHRPIWYAFDKVSEHKFRGVVMLGNPLVMWGGVAAMAVCAWGAIKSRAAYWITGLYLVLYGSWVIIPRKLAFYYYYYPAGLMLGLALAWVFLRLEAKVNKPWSPWLKWIFLGAALLLFAFFFPIYAAVEMPLGALKCWMWSSRWI